MVKDTEFRHGELRRARVVDIEGQHVAFVTPEDLLLSKLVWGRGGSEVQARDASKLVAHVKGARLGLPRSVGRRARVAEALAGVRRRS
ncbi:MAG: hypothetical protein M5U28_01940 [Sandaracinaceae bacterium]|nr:hypothetical protein [Sandaracinaceae bacterium]